MKISDQIICGLLSFTALCSSAFAIDCENEQALSKILNQFKLQYQPESLVSCKVLPNHSSQQVIAYAQQNHQSADHEDFNYKLSLITIDINGRVLSYYPVEEELVSDAISLNSITLDTAAYQLTANIRAIGLRLDYSGHSQPYPFSMQLLDLYDLQNKRKVLDSLIVERDRGEWDTRCRGEFEERSSTLMMLHHTTHHYADIQVRSKIYRFKTVDRSLDAQTKHDCQEIDHQNQQSQFILKYDGQHYRTPKLLKDDFVY